MNRTTKTCIAAIGIGVGAFAYVGKLMSTKGSAAVPRTGTFTGYVTDLKCKRNVNGDCNRRCFGNGEEPALLLDRTADILHLQNGDEAKRHPSAHVEVSGMRENDVIVVSKIVEK